MVQGSSGRKPSAVWPSVIEVIRASIVIRASDFEIARLRALVCNLKCLRMGGHVKSAGGWRPTAEGRGSGYSAAGRCHPMAQPRDRGSRLDVGSAVSDTADYEP